MLLCLFPAIALSVSLTTGKRWALTYETWLSLENNIWSGEVKHEGNGACFDMWPPSGKIVSMNLTLVSCVFDHVTSNSNGGCGVIHVAAANIDVKSCQFYSCWASKTGQSGNKRGGTVNLGSGPCVCNVSQCLFDTCHSQFNGGVIFMERLAAGKPNALFVEYTNFRNCYVNQGGGQEVTYDALLSCVEMTQFVFAHNEITWNTTDTPITGYKADK